MENAFYAAMAGHQQIETSTGAAQHVGDIAGVEHHALRLARCAGGIDDGDDILFGELDSGGSALQLHVPSTKDFVKKHDGRNGASGSGASSPHRFRQICIARADRKSVV